jgi:hypothetical protein
MLGKGQRMREDPAAAASGLILRVGIAILAIAVPCGAVISQRLLFVLTPVGAALMVIGGLMQPGERGRLDAVRGLAFAPLVQAMLFIVLWAGFSLLWTPFPEPAFYRFIKTAGTLAIAAIAIAALPHQVKASNSNLLPIGVAAAALAVVSVGLITPAALARGFEEDGTTLQRATIGIVVLVWPALGALALRQRVAAAGVIAVAVAVVAVFVWMPGALAALIVALLTFSSAYSNPMLAARVLALVTAALIVLAPAIPLVAQVFLTSRIDPDGIFASLPVWAQIVKSEGLRLVTGHGFDSAVRALANGYLPARAPRGILFEVWYELGALGAIGLACVAWNAFRAAGHASPAIAPFLLAALACALTIAIAGLSVAQLWWVTLLAVVGISFAIALRAHHREQRVGVREASTRRPAL